MLMNTQPTSSIGYVLKRAQHDLALAMERALDDTDVTLSRYAALAVLRDRGAISNAELARRCFVTPQTTIRMVKAMDADGLVDRRPNPDSRREFLVGLTSAGESALAVADERIRRVEEQMLVGFDHDARRDLLASLERIVSNLGDV